MKLALAGSSYKDRSLSAAAQECLNLYAETIEARSGSGKGTSLPLNSAGQAEATPPARVLTGCPGMHLFATLNAHPGVIRGMTSGGNLLYVAVGPTSGSPSLWYYTINSSGAIIASNNVVTNATATPVQLIPTGNQLVIIADGQVYVDNGSGPAPARFSIERFDLQINANNTLQCWDDNNPFTSADIGNNLQVIGGTNWFIQTVNITNVTSVAGKSMATCTANLGTIPGVIGRTNTITIDASNNHVCKDTGTAFTTADVGNLIEFYAGTGFNSIIGTITAVDGSGNATCDQAIGTLSSTGGSAWEWPPNPTGDALEINMGGSGFVTGVTGAFLDGSIYVQRPVTTSPDLGRQVNFSAVFDATNWNALDFFTKESAPDHIQSILADREMLFVFGVERETEVWQNSPTTGRPILVSGAVAAEPSASTYASVAFQEKLYYIGGVTGGGPVAYQVTGFTPQRISTHAVEDQWKENGVNISQSVGWWYEDEGHYFWVIWFPSGSTWVYDATENEWHERQNWNGTTLSGYRPWCHAYLEAWTADSGQTQGLHIVGDYYSAKLLVMNLAYADNEGGDLYNRRALPYLYNGGRRVFCGRITLALAPGPTVNLDWSADDGVTFSTPEAAQVPPTGNGSPLFWLAQGSFEYSAIPRLTITGQHQVTLVEMDADISYGTV